MRLYKLLFFVLLIPQLAQTYTPIKYQRISSAGLSFSYDNASSLFIKSGEVLVEQATILDIETTDRSYFVSEYNFIESKFGIDLNVNYTLFDDLVLSASTGYTSNILKQEQKIKNEFVEFGVEQFLGEREIQFPDQVRSGMNTFDLGASYFLLDTNWYVIIDLNHSFSIHEETYNQTYYGIRLGKELNKNILFLTLAYNNRESAFRDHLITGLGLEINKAESISLFGRLNYHHTINGFIDAYDVQPFLNDYQENYLLGNFGLILDYKDLLAQIDYTLKPYGENTINNSILRLSVAYQL